MGDRYRGPDGWTVEVVTLSQTPDARDGTWLRVRHLGYHVADLRTVAELERYLRVDSLEADGLTLAA